MSAFIKSIIYDAMILFIPKFQFRSKQYPKWLTKDLCHQLKCLHTLRRTYKHLPSDHIATQLLVSQAEDLFWYNAAKTKSNQNVLISNNANHSNPATYCYIRSFTMSATIPSTVYLDTTSAKTVTLLEQIFSTSTFIQYSLHPSSS